MASNTGTQTLVEFVMTEMKNFKSESEYKKIVDDLTKKSQKFEFRKTLHTKKTNLKELSTSYNSLLTKFSEYKKILIKLNQEYNIESDLTHLKIKKLQSILSPYSPKEEIQRLLSNIKLFQDSKLNSLKELKISLIRDINVDFNNYINSIDSIIAQNLPFLIQFLKLEKDFNTLEKVEFYQYILDIQSLQFNCYCLNARFKVLTPYLLS